MTQCEKVIDYIEMHGSITPLEALREFGCMRLASRISDLKRAGYNIGRTMETYSNMYGDKVRYARYTLENSD